MESTVVSLSRLKAKQKWVYTAHSLKAQEIEKLIAASPYDVVPLRDLVSEIEDGLHGVRNYVDDGVVLLAVGNVTEYGLDFTEKRMITPGEHERLHRSQVKRGDMLITITGRLGTSLIYESDEPANLSAHVARVRINAEKVRPQYLAAYFNSLVGKQQIDEYSIGSLYPHINVNRLEKVRVVLLPSELQKIAAEMMQNAYRAHLQKREDAKRKLDGIDEFVFRKLNISPQSVTEENRFLRSSPSVQHSRFDVEFNMGFHKFDPYIDSVVKVEDVVTFPKEVTDPTESPDKPFNYVDIASVDVLLGDITRTAELVGAAAPSRARQVIRRGNILISNVRPTRGATALVPESMDGYVCSTGFTIAHPTSAISSEFLHIALRLGTTLEQLGRRSAGSSYPAVLESDIRQTLIPCPDGATQAEIVEEVMQRRAAARQLRAEAEALVSNARRHVEQLILAETDPRSEPQLDIPEGLGMVMLQPQHNNPEPLAALE